MPATYTKISDAEMHEHLVHLGFEKIDLPGTYEKVYAKRVDVYGLMLSLRVYTTIEQGSGSRKVGKDAIRCELVWRAVKDTPQGDEPYVFVVGRSVRVHRTQNWKNNLGKRVEKWLEMLGPACPKCGAPMLVRSGKHGEFFGCSTFREGWCNSTMPINYNPE